MSCQRKVGDHFFPGLIAVALAVMLYCDMKGKYPHPEKRRELFRVPDNILYPGMFIPYSS
jgi:hypothetical protein